MFRLGHGKVLAGVFGAGVAASYLTPAHRCNANTEASRSKMEQLEAEVARMEAGNTILKQRTNLDNMSLVQKRQFLGNVKKTVAIFGGSFDPITSGHLNCACEIVHMRKADEVIASGMAFASQLSLTSASGGTGVAGAVRAAAGQALSGHTGRAPPDHVPPGREHRVRLHIPHQGLCGVCTPGYGVCVLT
jgi:hypothetical protein